MGNTHYCLLCKTHYIFCKNKNNIGKKSLQIKKQKYIWLSFAQKVLHPKFVSTECVVLFSRFPRTSKRIGFVYIYILIIQTYCNKGIWKKANLTLSIYSLDEMLKVMDMCTHTLSKIQKPLKYKETIIDFMPLWKATYAKFLQTFTFT